MSFREQAKKDIQRMYDPDGGETFYKLLVHQTERLLELENELRIGVVVQPWLRRWPLWRRRRDAMLWTRFQAHAFRRTA